MVHEQADVSLQRICQQLHCDSKGPSNIKKKNQYRFGKILVNTAKIKSLTEIILYQHETSEIKKY